MKIDILIMLIGLLVLIFILVYALGYAKAMETMIKQNTNERLNRF